MPTSTILNCDINKKCSFATILLQLTRAQINGNKVNGLAVNIHDISIFFKALFRATFLEKYIDKVC